MSNTGFIQQEIVVSRHSGNTRKQVCVYDNYSREIIDLSKLSNEDSFFNDEMDLLRAVVRIAINNNRDLMGILECQNDIAVEGVYYPHKEVQRIIKEELSHL